MGYVVKGNDFTPPPEGLHNAVCVDIVDMGERDTPWGRKKAIRLVWELEEEMEDGRRFVASKRYSPSLHEKATLRKDLKGWRGRDFTPEELQGFDLDNVLHAPCQLVVQQDTKNGITYGNVVTLMKAAKDHKLEPSGKYVRKQDRDDAKNGDGERASAEEWPHEEGPEAEADIPF